MFHQSLFRHAVVGMLWSACMWVNAGLPILTAQQPGQHTHTHTHTHTSEQGSVVSQDSLSDNATQVLRPLACPSLYGIDELLNFQAIDAHYSNYTIL